MSVTAKKLNARQMKFVDNLMEGMSQVDAYAGAGYKGSNNTLRTHAARMVANGNIKADIERRIAASRAKGRRWLAERQEKAQEILDTIIDEPFSNDIQVRAWKLKQQVAHDIFDRNGLKPPAKIEQEHDVKGDLKIVIEYVRPDRHESQ